MVTEDVPALRCINSRLLDDYIADCQGGIDGWNKVIEKSGIDLKSSQPQDFEYVRIDVLFRHFGNSSITL